MTDILCQLSFLFNFMALIMFFVYAYKHHKYIFNSATASLIIGTILLTIYLGIEGKRARTCPSLLSYLSYAFMALLIYLIYFVAAFKFRIRLLGSFAIPIAFVFQAISLFLQPTESVAAKDSVSAVVVGLHTGLVMLGHALFSLAFAAALMYIIQEKNLKSKRFNHWYHRLPSLAKLKELGGLGILSGYPLMTAGLILGIYWATRRWGGDWYVHREIIWSIVSWIIFSWLFYGKVADKLKGRRFLVWIILGFVIILASYFITPSFSSVHGTKQITGGP